MVMVPIYEQKKSSVLKKPYYVSIYSFQSRVQKKEKPPAKCKMREK